MDVLPSPCNGCLMMSGSIVFAYLSCDVSVTVANPSLDIRSNGLPVQLHYIKRVISPFAVRVTSPMPYINRARYPADSIPLGLTIPHNNIHVYGSLVHIHLYLTSTHYLQIRKCIHDEI